MSVGIIGAGRAGASLAAALQEANYEIFVHSRERKTLPVSFEITSGNSIPWLGKADVVVLAVPDAKIPDLAERIAATAQLNERHVVLHLSGALDEDALRALAPSGAALGSFSGPLMMPLGSTNAPQQVGARRAACSAQRRIWIPSDRLNLATSARPVLY